MYFFVLRALDLQVHCADVPLQSAGRWPSRTPPLAVAAGVGPALLVHRLDVPRQVALRLVGDTGAVGARVLAQLQVHEVDVLRQAGSWQAGRERKTCDGPLSMYCALRLLCASAALGSGAPR
jgi:hypothetical protein